MQIKEQVCEKNGNQECQLSVEKPVNQKLKHFHYASFRELFVRH
jgi:hypothetical protein